MVCVSARGTTQLVWLPCCSALPFPQGKESRPPGRGGRGCLRAERAQSSCSIGQEVFDATGTPRCCDTWPPHPCRAAASPFSWEVLRPAAGGGHQHLCSGSCLADLLPPPWALCAHTFQARLCPAGTGIWKVIS